jgi:hypothetical protein
MKEAQMPRPKGSKNKPKTGVVDTVKRIRKPREKKVVNPHHVGKSTWVRPTHYYVIYFQLKNSCEFFTYTEKETGATSLCNKLNAETAKGKYFVKKIEYPYPTK